VRALARGTSLRQILELVAELRAGGLETPIVLFGYYNPIFHYGPARLAADAARAGADGLLIVDLPPEEADELWRPARAEGLDVIFLLAPTSDARRVRAVLRKASGFVYFVSMTGITGTKAIDAGDVRRMIEDLRASCRLPIGVGFGITTPPKRP
jgi:tryptophan synthase alpha chain